MQLPDAIIGHGCVRYGDSENAFLDSKCAPNLVTMETRRSLTTRTHRKGELPMPKGQEKKKTNNKPKLTVKEKKKAKKEKASK